MKQILAELDDAMLTALLDWRSRKGRSWKTELWAAWMNGTDERDPRAASLRTIRNRLGPTWLDKLRPRDLDAAASQREIDLSTISHWADEADRCPSASWRMTRCNRQAR